MMISREKTQYHTYSFSYDFSEEVDVFCKSLSKKYGGIAMNFYGGKWRFANPQIAIEIKKTFPNTKIPVEIFLEIERQKKVEDASIVSQMVASLKHEEPLGKIRGIKGDLYPYQRYAVEFFEQNNGRAILADEMGTGKTLQTLAYIVHAKKNRSLIICPASVKYGWESEVEKWTSLKSYVVDGKTDFRDIPYDVNVVIVNYDILKKHFNQLMMVRWDLVVGDEFHMIKSNSAKRTKAFKAIARRVDSVILLSGTPLLSRPIELFNGLQLMDPKTWSNYYDYSFRYCDGHQTRYGWDSKGATNVEELHNRISKYFLRRTKDDVLPFLPKKIPVDMPVDLSSEYKNEYKKIQDEFAMWLHSVKKKTNKEIAKYIAAEKLVKINFLRQITSDGKVDAAIELIENIVESGQKVLVFSSFNEPLEKMHKKFKGSVLLTGKVDAEKRRDIINQFQTDPDTKIFFGGIISSGVGITLTAASSAVFLDYSWNPADHSQAIDRMHRPGTKAKSVTVYQLYSKNTIDEFMRKTLQRKQKIFEKLIDGSQSKGGGAFLKQFFDDIVEEYETNLLN